jgi:hypothetical protein
MNSPIDLKVHKLNQQSDRSRSEIQFLVKADNFYMDVLTTAGTAIASEVCRLTSLVQGNKCDYKENNQPNYLQQTRWILLS